MRGAAWLGPLLGVGLAFVSSLPHPARGEVYSPYHDLEISTVLLFSGYDLWRNGGFAHGGALWSPQGLARDGFMLKALIGAGVYRYQSGAIPVRGEVYAAALMPGWRFVRGTLDVAVYGGLDAQHHLVTGDPANRLRGFNLGFRTGADLWWEPAANAMVNASMAASTIGAGYWARAAYGWRLFDRFFAGPEITALGDDNYRQFRVGVHVTAFRWAAFEWSAGLGYVRDSDDRSGAYARIGLLTRH